MIVYLRRVGLFVGLILLQVLILNNIHIYGYGTPFLYVFFLLIYSSNASKNTLMLWAFFIGLIIDTFTNTPGINTASATFLAFIRDPILNSFTLHDNNDIFEPGISSMGLNSFIKYIVALTLIFCICLQLLNSFSFFDPIQLLIKILTDTLSTAICILCVDAVWRR